MKINHLEIVLDAITKQDDRWIAGSIIDSLKKELKTRKYLSKRLFFKGCRMAVSDIKCKYDDEINKRKNKFNLLLLHGSPDGKSFAQSELDNFNNDDYPLNLVIFNAKYKSCYLVYSKFELIFSEINSAENLFKK